MSFEKENEIEMYEVLDNHIENHVYQRARRLHVLNDNAYYIHNKIQTLTKE
jgi:hypothetical protein